MGNDNEDMLEISEGNPDKTNSNSSYRGTINSISSGPSSYLPGMYSPNNHVSSSSSTSSTSFTHFHGEEINLHYAPGPFSLLSSNFSGKGNNLTSKIDVKGLTSNGPMANANDDNNNVVGRLHNAIQGLFDLRFKTNENVAIDQQTWSRNNFNMQNMEGISLNGERANNDDYRNKSEGCINLYVRQALLKYNEALSHILEKYSDIRRQGHDQSDAVSEGKVNIRLGNTETVGFRHYNMLRRLSVSLDHLLTTDVLQDQSKFREQMNDLTQFANILSIEGVHDENVDTLGKTLKQILSYFDTTTEDCLRNTRNDESILPNYTELLSRNSSVTSTSSNENHVNADMDESRGSALSSRENQQERSNDMHLDESASNTGQFRNETTESSTVNTGNRQQVNSQNSDENENKNGEEEEEEEEMELEGYCTDLSVHVSEEGLKAMGLLCSICFNIPRDPVKTSKSYNLYCFKCLDKCHGDPADASSRISKSDYNFDIGDRKVQIENMILKCPHAEKHGCDWTNPLQAWDAHVRDTCTYTKIPCPYCNLPFMRLDMEDHINRQHRYLCKFCEDVSLHPAEELAHLEICPARPVSCPVCGDNGVKQNELRSHIETTHSIEEITSSLLEKESLRNQLIEKQNQTEKELRALKDHNEKYTMTKGKTVYKVFKLSRGTKVCYEGEVIEVINLTGGVNVCFEDGKSMVVQKDYLLFSPPRGIITYKEYLANRASRNYL